MSAFDYTAVKADDKIWSAPSDDFEDYVVTAYLTDGPFQFRRPEIIKTGTIEHSCTLDMTYKFWVNWTARISDQIVPVYIIPSEPWNLLSSDERYYLGVFSRGTALSELREALFQWAVNRAPEAHVKADDINYTITRPRCDRWSHYQVNNLISQYDHQGHWLLSVVSIQVHGMCIFCRYQAEVTHRVGGPSGHFPPPLVPEVH